MRLDLFLYKNGYAESRTVAKWLITEGAVTLSGKKILKPSVDVAENAAVEVDTSVRKYVSRGGLKLEAALKSFDVCVEDRDAIDLGASSGGFTDCLLSFGAKRVIAVDSGKGQLVQKLLSDGHVASIESFNARYMTPGDLPYVPNFAVMDVSFISATYLMKPLYDCLAADSDYICLIKPQFEVGRANVGKGGIVKSEKARITAVNSVVEYAKSIGFKFIRYITSPIEGGDGNVEYLAHFKK